MKIVTLVLDGDIAQIKFCDDPTEWINNFSLTITKTLFDETRNSAKIEVFDISLVDKINFFPGKIETGRKINKKKEFITRFKNVDTRD